MDHKSKQVRIDDEGGKRDMMSNQLGKAKQVLNVSVDHSMYNMIIWI